MKKFLLPILTLSLSLTQGSFACDLHGNSGIVAENKLWIPDGLKSMSGINEMQFNRVIDRVNSLYKKKVSALGGKLTFERNWQDGTVNAYARRDDETGKIWYVAMFGGLARHSAITEDGFAMVVCHELGHHLGGAPKKKDAMGKIRWASNEGQADYYASLKCMREYFSGMDNQAALKRLKVPFEVLNRCQKSFANAEEIAICQRTAVAGLSLGNLFKDLEGTKAPLSFTTPDKNKVKVTSDTHPAAQCRLDTYYQGSLCDKSVDDDVSDTDVTAGTCTTKGGDRSGIRPGCWYAGN